MIYGAKDSNDVSPRVTELRLQIATNGDNRTTTAISNIGFTWSLVIPARRLGLGR
ncbi:MAG TPA: hypothetical protein G4O12_00460 [Dehalococcoidia bacterium]|nr:hypothetical protein [Dehalococcoidia bacterium]